MVRGRVRMQMRARRQTSQYQQLEKQKQKPQPMQIDKMDINSPFYIMQRLEQDRSIRRSFVMFAES